MGTRNPTPATWAWVVCMATCSGPFDGAGRGEVQVANVLVFLILKAGFREIECITCEVVIPQTVYTVPTITFTCAELQKMTARENIISAAVQQMLDSGFSNNILKSTRRWCLDREQKTRKKHL